MTLADWEKKAGNVSDLLAQPILRSMVSRIEMADKCREAYLDGARAMNAAAANKVIEFNHTRRDCEAGTTVEEIAEDIRVLVSEDAKRGDGPTDA